VTRGVRRHQQAGFSFVELMVVTGIMALVSGMLVVALRMGQQSWQVEQARMTVSMELRRGLDAMSRELASSQSGQLVGVPADGTWYTSLTFRVPQDLNGDGTVLDANGALEWSPPVVYALGGTGGTQILRIQNNATRVLANGATTLRFRRQAATPNILEISMTVLRGVNTGDFTNQGTLNTQVRLRN